MLKMSKINHRRDIIIDYRLWTNFHDYQWDPRGPETIKK